MLGLRFFAGPSAAEWFTHKHDHSWLFLPDVAVPAVCALCLGVVFYNMSDVPLGFGVTAFSTKECRTVESTAVVAFHQADVGEYLRSEEEM